MILHKFPNYDSALPVEEVDARALDSATFRKEFVARNRPFIAKGAAAHWKACQSWTPAILKDRLKAIDNIFESAIGLVTKPFAEYSGHVLEKPEESGSEFLERLIQGEQATAYSVSLDHTPGIDALWNDLGRLPFYDPKPGTGYLYQNRVFIYRGGYTDWHCHYGDETVTVQTMGTKEMLLLPSDTQSFESIMPVAKSESFATVNPANYPALKQLRPYRAILTPGDAIYIPIYWWHAVEPINDDIGLTAAFVFKTPVNIQFDLRFRGARFNLVEMTQRKQFRRYIPLALLGAAASFLRHPFAPPYRNSMTNRL